MLSELAEKEIIEVTNGVRYGFLANTECVFDPKSGKIIGFELHQSALKTLFQTKQANVVEMIKWEDLVLIGEDRVLFRKRSADSK